MKIDDEFVDYVLCKGCRTVLKWKSRDGTSGLKSHNQSGSCCKKPAVSRNISTMLAPVGVAPMASKKKKISAEDKSALNGQYCYNVCNQY